MYRIQIQHLHEGNTTLKERHNSKYMTIAKLVDENGDTIKLTTARCCPNDAPSRREGRRIAIGRMLEQITPGTEIRIL